MDSIESKVKLFNISNQLAENELDLLEQRLGIDLGRGHNKKINIDQDYYPQIDSAIRSEAARMGEHYEIFYSLEKSIRSLVTEIFQAAAGLDWWNSGRVPQSIKQEAEVRMKRELESGMTPRSENPIDFTTFGELGDLIKSNWELFKPLFRNPKAVERVMANLNSLRGPIAHCCLLADDEMVRLRLSVRDWFRLME